jgi:hypothetical protein
MTGIAAFMADCGIVRLDTSTECLHDQCSLLCLLRTLIVNPFYSITVQCTFHKTVMHMENFHAAFARLAMFR